MNVIGFLLLHDEFSCAKSLESLSIDADFKIENYENILQYLDNGTPAIKYISAIYDHEGERLGPNIVFTDGEWIWPSYYSFYIKKYHLSVPYEFKKHVNAQKSMLKKISTYEKQYVEYLIAKLLKVNIPNIKQLPAELRLLIEQRGEDVACY